MSQAPLHRGTDLVLSVEGVNKTFDGFKAISDLNFYLAEGELRTIIGPNGAGKSTFMDMITGRTRPDTGSLTLHKPDGHDIDLTKQAEYKITRLGIARKFQTPSVYTQHTVYDNLLLSLPRARGLFSSLFYRESKEDRERIDEVLETIRLTELRHSIAGALSHGQKQWLEIGMLLSQQPAVLLVDEPAAGMSDDETHRTGELLISLAGKHSLIVIEHDMTFVKQIARDGKVTVLHQGTVLCEGKFDEVQSNPKVREVYLGRGKAA
ncbi:urea transport system ATP-binding protein [Haloferula luteola]|uniref:Urea transport system ATP-binding protein n=1 Tax=Haloferula luteola TaxID=595692 RepID=A0A840VFZ4_9BACT|nr:urea ABC transporter ATP-binding protein UrtD [Haloferula luteola]MBB5352739.1 urea transport system ATP-binding protein [Haloferula luteola]